MNRSEFVRLWTVLIAAFFPAGAATAADMVVLRGTVSQVSIATEGGGIVEFRFLNEETNPLNWEISEELEPRTQGKPFLKGHFLCLDRWGAPSEAESDNGVPFHGEAPRVVWQVTRRPEGKAGKVVAEMGCVLPLAGMKVRRKLQLDQAEALLRVTEEVTNTNKLGRIYNMVQHPTIAPPFLDETTLVDTNARHGFAQEGSVPPSKKSAAVWPKIVIDGRPVDLRQLKNAAEHVTGSDVTSFVFDEADEYGWVTACNPGKGLLIGYLWKTKQYPWLNIWRYRFEGRVAARGLEFGTTGYHKPYPVLVATGQILNRRLYEYIDAGETVEKSYAMFLAKVPQDYHGVARLTYEKGRLILAERRDNNQRTVTLEVGELFGN